MSATAAPMLPARFWPRYLAWSLDAVVVAALTTLIGASHWRHQADAARAGYAAMNARMAEVMSSAALDDLDFGGFAQQLIADPALHAAGTAAVAALSALILGWVFLFALLGLVYELGFGSFSSWRTTPGKRALGMRVTALDGRPLDSGRAALRYLAGGLSWATLNIGHVMAMAGPEYRALHDRIAGARVLRARDARTPLWAWAWLLLQVAVTLAACAWLLRAMQASMDAALYQAGAI